MVWCFFTLLTTWLKEEEEAHIESQQVKIAMKYCIVVTTFLLLGCNRRIFIKTDKDDFNLLAGKYSAQS